MRTIQRSAIYAKNRRLLRNSVIFKLFFTIVLKFMKPNIDFLIFKLRKKVITHIFITSVRLAVLRYIISAMKIIVNSCIFQHRFS